MKQKCSSPFYLHWFWVLCGVFFVLFSLSFFSHLPTLQATSRDETIDPSFGMRRPSLKLTNTQDITHITHPCQHIPPKSIRTTALRAGWHLSKVRLGGEVNRNPKRTILGQLVVLLISQKDFSCSL